MSYVLAFGMPSLPELALLAAIGLLFFGKRLPEVGRSLGKGIVEFKKGLKDIGGDIDDQVAIAEKEEQQRKLDQPKPKFDPYTGKPVVEAGHKFDPYTGKPIGEEVHVETVPKDDSASHQG